MMQLSPHFTLTEACKSQTAIRLRIDNTPPAPAIPCLRLVAEFILESCRVHYDRPIVPSSWYRSLELNAAIGGKATSQHVLGQAVDFEVAGVSNVDLARWMADNIEFDQLILEWFDEVDPSSGWVHASYVSHSKNRGQVLRFDGKQYRSGLP